MNRFRDCRLPGNASAYLVQQQIADNLAVAGVLLDVDNALCGGIVHLLFAADGDSVEPPAAVAHGRAL